MSAKPILIIEDEHALGSALELLLRRMGHLPTLKASGRAGLEALARESFAAVVIDIGLPDMSGLDVLAAIRAEGGSLPVLVITAHATLQHAIDSQKCGATAYLNKPLDLKELQQQLTGLLESGLSPEETKGRNAESESSPTLIGAAPCLRKVFVGIARACAGDFPVLLHGPGGSGKTLAARLIHARGTRAQGPLIETPAETLEDWKVRQEWRGGTLVLDEITALSRKLQIELANWLGEGEGDAMRVIATTRREPAAAVERGELREELYFAFKPATLEMPSLRERSGDIPALCAFFSGLRQESGEGPEITLPAMRALQAHDWPGNVRELRHVLDYALSMSRGGPLFASHLPESVGAGKVAPAAEVGGELEAILERWLDQELAGPVEHSYDELLARIETVMLRHLMERHDHKPTRLAAEMRLHRGTLRQKLLRYGLQ